MTHFSFASLTERELTAVNGGTDLYDYNAQWYFEELPTLPFEPFPTILPIPQYVIDTNIW